jgi:hypothetical protein
MLSTARRYRSVASRWADIRDASRAPDKAVSNARRLSPARSKCTEEWISEWPSSCVPNSPARA